MRIQEAPPVRKIPKIEEETAKITTAKTVTGRFTGYRPAARIAEFYKEAVAYRKAASEEISDFIAGTLQHKPA